jgi:hypothetical protein
MSFDTKWLDLREPADHAARDARLLAEAAGWLAAADAPLAVDLGAGTGSTIRAFGSLAAGARWRLLDNDPALLAEAARRHGGAEAVAADLADVAALPLEGARLVTASALIDLVSDAWLVRLADRLAADRLGFYAALSYDGEMAWEPADPRDDGLLLAFNAHQHSDKGLGPALGPAAGTRLADVMAARGFVVRTAASPWRLGPDRGALQAELAAGMASAAADAEAIGGRAADWAQRRRATAGASSCTVGHLDVLALPA